MTRENYIIQRDKLLANGSLMDEFLPYMYAFYTNECLLNKQIVKCSEANFPPALKMFVNMPTLINNVPVQTTIARGIKDTITYFNSKFNLT